MTTSEIHNLNWNGITLEITLEHNQVLTRITGEDHANIQVRSLSPLHAPLPLAERGFYKDSVSASILKAAGGAVAYIDIMLDVAA